MASRSRLSLCVLLLLLLAVVFAGHGAVAAAAPPPVAAEAPGQGHGGGGGAVAAGCWRSVMETTQPCARDVLRTVAFGAVHLGRDCCAVLGRVGERCVVDVFSSLPLGAAYVPVVNRICGLVSSLA